MEFDDLKVEIPLEDEENNPSPLLDVLIKKYENNDGEFVTGFDVTTKEAQEKKLKRATRFGISTESVKNQQEKKPIRFFENIPKTKQADEVRPDAILLFGVNEMSTKDVFDYFKDYMPGSIEWIDDDSCVVVWEDENSVKRALANMAIQFTPADNDDETNVQEVGNIWKVGQKHPNSKQLLMRYATKSDRKTRGAGGRSLYYLIHGKPNQSKQRAKKRGLVSTSRKKKIVAEQQRIAEELNPTPEVEILDIDDSSESEMDVDEPPVKVLISEDVVVGGRIPRGNLYADQENGGHRKARSRLRKPAYDDNDSDDDDIFQVCQLTPSVAKMDMVNPGRLSNDGDVHSNNTKLPDLREKLKRGKKHFNPRIRPTLSIEITGD